MICLLSDKLILPMEERFYEYLRDESQLSGQADSISFACCESELQDLVRSLSQNRVPMTVQGARTGIVGAAVPTQGHILSLTRMDHMLALHKDKDGFLVDVEPGVRLDTLNDCLSKKRFPCQGWSASSCEAADALRTAPAQLFAPDPTETSCTIGGMYACNASGLRTLPEGCRTADYVEGVRLLLACGDIWDIRRGQYLFSNNGCRLPDGTFLPAYPSDLPYPMLPVPGRDLVDLLAASEGMLGIITRLTLRLVDAPNETWGVLFFFDDDAPAIDFSLQCASNSTAWAHAKITVLEYYDHCALALINEMKKQAEKLAQLPNLPADLSAAIYLELAAGQSDAAQTALETLLASFMDFGGREEDTWAACGDAEISLFRLMRHAVPEAANLRVARNRLTSNQITKLGADMSVPKERLRELFAMFRFGLASNALDGTIFGHIGASHLHVNLFAHSQAQQACAQSLFLDWAKQVTLLGGCFARENGIGKLKRAQLAHVAPAEVLWALGRVKDHFDPLRLLNPGNMLEESLR